MQSSVERGSSITPKQRMQSPRIFLAKLAEQASVVEGKELVVVVVVVVETGEQILPINSYPSSQEQTGKPPTSDAFSMHVQVSPGRGSSKTPMHGIQSPRILRAWPDSHGVRVVVLVVVVEVDVDRQ